MACDSAINPMLVDAGLTLPKEVLMDHRFRGMSAEEIYNRLEAEEDQSSPHRDGGRNQQSRRGAAGEEQAAGDPDTRQVPETIGGIGQVLDAVADAKRGSSSVGGKKRE